ncbi:MAG: 50S ribosomal protein L25 [Thermoleophilia bacterium]|nr:50S ribosomal protein L25 [Thermoleophilia bacterium]
MDTIKLSVHEREETGNGPARRLRAKGLVPAITYAKGKEATSISIVLDELRAAVAHGHNVVLELDFDKGAKGKSKAGSARYAVVKQIQYHPTKRSVLHVDLHEVDLAVEIEAPVPVELIGSPAGLADGGVLEWERREVVVRALPSSIPSTLELDVSELAIGHHLSAGQVKMPEGVTLADDPETLIIALVPPRVEQEPVAEAEAVEEPEVIGAQKEEE